MKVSLYTMSLLAATMLFAACAQDRHQKVGPETVPPAVKSAFQSQYPDAVDVQWSIEKKEDDVTIYEADYKLNGKEGEVEYNENGMVVEADFND